MRRSKFLKPQNRQFYRAAGNSKATLAQHPKNAKQKPEFSNLFIILIPIVSTVIGASIAAIVSIFVAELNSISEMKKISLQQTMQTVLDAAKLEKTPNVLANPFYELIGNAKMALILDAQDFIRLQEINNSGENCYNNFSLSCQEKYAKSISVFRRAVGKDNAPEDAIRSVLFANGLERRLIIALKKSDRSPFDMAADDQIDAPLEGTFKQAPASPPPIPTMEAAVPSAQMPRSYLVFFNWGEVNFSPRGHQIIADAAKTSKFVAYTRIEVIGYADQSGSRQANESLARRRAESVATELVQLGVAKETIDVQAFGDSRPLVPMPNGEREPQNRRVEILLR